MELVHDDVMDVGVLAFAQGEIGEDLRRAADDRCGWVDGRIPGDHSDIFRPEGVAERKEFLVGQRLDRDGVIGTPTEADGTELECQGNE